MECKESAIADKFPLHYLVWKNNVEGLQQQLSPQDGGRNQHLEQLDPRGRTPLMLAVTLEHVECVSLLIDHGAHVDVENKEGWTVVQEAVATGNRNLLSTVLAKRDMQRHTSRMHGVPAILCKLKEVPDFYMEMKWEFTSWVRVVAKMFPSDTYRVYKQGSNVRIDTTLLGFDQSSWNRGNRSYLFKAEDPQKALLMEVDHDSKEVFVEELRTIQDDVPVARNLMIPSEEAVRSRLTSPLVHTYLDTVKISFERNKSGIWGWRSDKVETINGRECKVFSASNVELVTKTRSEHLSAEDKSKMNNSRSLFNTLLPGSHVEEMSLPTNGSEPITLEQYFNAEFDLGNRDIGRPKELTSKIQKFKANLWLCEEFPLKLAEQIMPIVDLMAISTSHFAKLRDFIQMQLPAGFPLKIEIPLFHVINACVTFGNTFALDEPVEGVSTLQEEDRLTCVLDDSCFEIPSDYNVYGMGKGSSGRRQFSMDEEDELVQYAIQQSLLDAGSEGDEVDIWEALKAQRPSTPHESRNMVSRNLPPRPMSAQGMRLSPGDEELQRAIEASLGICSGVASTEDVNFSPDGAEGDPLEQERRQLAEALAISARESALEEERRLKEDDEILRRVLELSLLEK